MIGAVFFMLAVLMLISSAFIGGSEYRSSFDTVDVESAFFAAAGELGIPVQKKQVNPNIDYIATGKAEIGVLEMRIRSVKNPRINVHDMNFSRIALSCLSNNAHPNIMIESVNDALDIQNAPDALKESVISFIKEKNLDYFNFRLEGEPGGVHVSVSVALEEKEAWMDYLELLKRVVV
jgi:type II restriction/modification system DNA methylase subunit YeeA